MSVADDHDLIAGRVLDGAVLVEQDAAVAPADRDDVEVAVAVDVGQNRAVVVLVADGDDMAEPAAAPAVGVLEDP